MSDSSDATRTGLHLHADFAPGTVVADRFRIESLLGVGGMGVVYKAVDQALDVPVALKLLRPELASHPEAFERFRQELLLARQVSSPHVVRIHDIGQHDGRWLISMDYIEGESLDKRMDREGRFDPAEALRIARQVAEGLGAAHARGVVHRDLKPANVLIDGEGNAYVNDFGVARSLVSGGMTQSGSVVGTPDYLSPEQARGDTVDQRSDLYALGLILYEMLSGELPFSGGTAAEVLGQRMVRTPVPVTRKRPDVPAWIARLLDKLLRPQPAHRFGSARDLIAAIDAGTMPMEFHPGRKGWLALAALLALAVGLGGAWWWWQQRPVATAVATIPSLHRLLVLPLERGPDLPAQAGPAEAFDQRLLALSDVLRDAIAEAGEVVVDGDRTWQALQQIDPTGGARANPDALRGIAAADRALRPQLRRADGEWRVHASLHGAGRAPEVIEGPAASDPAKAVEAFLDPLAAAFSIAPGRLKLDLPPDAALEPYGAGLRRRYTGFHALALDDFTRAVAVAPKDARLLLAQAEAAQAIGEVGIASAAIGTAKGSLAGSPDGLKRQVTALAAMLEGDAEAAVAQWQARSQAQPDDTLAALQLARARGAAGDLEAATADLQTLVEKDDNDPRAWFELGKHSILLGDARRAVDDYLVRALVLYKRSRDLYGQAETVNAMGIAYGRLGQTADAEEQYRKAVELRRTVGNRRGVATSLRNLAGVVSLRGEFAAANTYLGEARALYESLGDRDGLAATENEAGLLAEERGDYPGALAAFRRALQAWQQSGNGYGAAGALNSIGYAHYQLGAYDSALVFWQQAADAFDKLGDQTGQVRTAQNLGLLAIARGQWDEARTLLLQSQEQAEQQQMLEEVAVSRRNLAELELVQGHLDAAIAHAERAEALFEQREDLRGQTDAGLLRVQALLAAGATDRAREALQALREPLQQASSEQQAIAALLESAMALGERGRTQANAALADADRLAKNSGVRHLQLEVLLMRAARGQPDPTLEQEIAALGHQGLRLRWLESAMSRALQDGDATRALQHYQQAVQVIRDQDYLRAHALHALAARAHRMLGDAASAQAAEEAGRSALRKLRSHVPEQLQSGFDAMQAPE
ncbi:protein kinase domain-containing protein [Luteimonas vadosa]|uniref:Protein kinase domain-containing protein n=1 Tax=Luteimonas vadosa TaxID=1165507 RepID=A0ABP9DQJ7_9GAMM